MNLLKTGSNVYNKILSKKNPLFSVSVKSQQKFLNNLDSPKDDFERSFNQYLCQKQGLSFFNKFILNFGSFFLYFYYMYFKKNDLLHSEEEQYNALFISSKPNYSCIPNSLFEQYGEIKHNDNKGFYLTKVDKEFLKGLRKRHKFSYFFQTKCLLKIAIYGKAIVQYNPKAIIVTSEYSFCSSVLTKYCVKHEIKHINIMHGEKLLYIRDSFFHFNTFYVWDKHYITIFNQQKALCDKYIIEIPLSQKKWDISNIQKTIDFTYYLGDEQLDLLVQINKNLLKLKEKGFRIAIRPHPVYSNMNLIDKIFSEFIIEDTLIDIKESILRTNAVISLFSTVNRQATINGVKCIIDDISNKQRYIQMQELQYFFVLKKHHVLSEYIK